MEPLSIVIDVENYKIGIDASPKRAVDYSVRQKLKRPIVETTGPVKVMRIEPILERTEVKLPERPKVAERLSAFEICLPTKTYVQVRRPQVQERKLTVPESIPAAVEIPFRRTSDNTIDLTVPRTVISHTAESLARSSVDLTARSSVDQVARSSVGQSGRSSVEQKAREPTEADTSSRSPQQGTSSSSEMWRPW